MNSLFSYHSSLIIIFIAILFSTEKINTSSASTTQNSETPFECRFKRMGGTIPNRACAIRDFLIKLKNSMEQRETYEKIIKIGFQNFYIFYGDYGVGKTSCATYLAEEANVEVIIISGQDLHDRIKKSISPNAAFNEIFENAIEQSKKIHKTVIVLIDEMDQIWQNCDTSVKEKIFGALRSNLDKNRNNPSLFVIFTINSVQNIDLPFTNRCTLIKWEFPNKENRMAILKFYASIYGIQLSDDFCLQMATKTEGFNGRDFYFAFRIANDEADRNHKSCLSENDILVGIEEKSKEIKAKKITWPNWIKKQATEYKTATTILVTGAAGATLAVTEVVVKKLTGISIIETIQNLSNKQGSK